MAGQGGLNFHLWPLGQLSKKDEKEKKNKIEAALTNMKFFSLQ